MNEQATLVDELREVKRQLKVLKEKEDALVSEIKENFDLGEVILGSEGAGYKLTTQSKLKYSPFALDWIIGKGIAKEFMSVTTAKLEGLAKKKVIQWSDLETLQQDAVEETTVVLREFVPEEAKVFG